MIVSQQFDRPTDVRNELKTRHAVFIDIGSSSVNGPGTAGGSAKFRIYDIATQNCLGHFPSDDGLEDKCYVDLMRSLAGQDPDTFFARIADQVSGFSGRLLPTPVRIEQVFVGFPAMIISGHAPVVENLFETMHGQLTAWREVPVRKLLSKHMRLREHQVTVVNDIIPGIAGYISSERNRISAGDHIAYVAVGGGCGIAEAMVFAGGILLKATEMGHMLAVPSRSYRNGSIVAGSRQRPMRLEKEFCSTTAIERLFCELTGQNRACSEILSIFANNDSMEANIVINRFVEGLALLGSNLAAGGVTRLVLAGPLSNRISTALLSKSGRSLSNQVAAKTTEICRLDLAARLRIEEFCVLDNTRGGELLLNSKVESPERSDWIHISEFPQ